MSAFVQKLDAESLNFFNTMCNKPFADQAVFLLNAFYDELVDDLEYIYSNLYEIIKSIDMKTLNIHYLHQYDAIPDEKKTVDLDFDMALHFFELHMKDYNGLSAEKKAKYAKSNYLELTAIARKKEIRETVDANYDGRVSFLEALLYIYKLSPRDLLDRCTPNEPVNEAYVKAKAALEEVNRRIREYEEYKMGLEKTIAEQTGVKQLTAKNLLAQLGASPLAEELRKALILAEAAVRRAIREGGANAGSTGGAAPRVQGQNWWIQRELQTKKERYGTRMFSAIKRLAVRNTKGLRQMSTLANVDSTKLVINKTSHPKPKEAYETLKFGHTFTDHMLEIDWDAEKGWAAPVIKPHGDLSIDPAASSLHYALQCFEGMKAYIDDAGKIRLFRPERNMKRLNHSSERLLLPNFDGEQVLKCLEELLRIDKSWIPNKYGYSLYIRPTMISTTPFLGVAPPTKAKLFIIASPVGPYYPTGFAPVKLLADPQYVRAWPGGTGNIKCGGNYAMSIGPAREAAAKGYQQLLWLFGDNHQVTEVGTMNIFWFWTNKETGEKELVTAPLDGTILPGITRDSVIQLAKSWGIKVREEHYTMDDILSAVKDGRIIEAFGSGTAAIVSPVKAVGFLGTDYAIPLNKNDPAATAGELTQKVADTIMGIQYGKLQLGGEFKNWSQIVQE